MKKKPMAASGDALVFREAVAYLVTATEFLLASALADERVDAEVLKDILDRTLFFKAATRTGGVVPVSLSDRVM